MDKRGRTPNVQRLEVLYILSKMGALEEPELEAFCIESGFLGYMELRLAVSELLDESCLISIPGKKGSAYLLTAEGWDSLSHFLGEIPFSLRESIDGQSHLWRARIHQERQVFADFEEHGEGFRIRLYLLEEAQEMLDIRLEAPSKQQALLICENWRKDTVGTYQKVLRALLGEEADGV